MKAKPYTYEWFLETEKNALLKKRRKKASIRLQKRTDERRERFERKDIKKKLKDTRNALAKMERKEARMARAITKSNEARGIYITIYEQYGFDSPTDAMVCFKEYRKMVYKLTNANPYLTELEHYDKRAFRGKDAWHVDHIKSIWNGWLDGDLPYVIADISNLQMMQWKDNMAKGIR